MKKLFALPVIGLILGAVAIATEIRTTDLLPMGQQLSGTVVACIKTAVEKKELTLISALSTYQNNSLITLTTRKTALLAAWDKTTKSAIKTAISATWKSYKKSMSTSKSTLHTSRNSAWSTFRTDVTSCKGNLVLQNIDTSSERNEE